jgi:geranylgeranyl pyrophosphate synthase
MMKTTIDPSEAFAKLSAEYLPRINEQLRAALPPPDTRPTYLHQAMHYAVLNGGKRLRPLLVYLSGRVFNLPLSTLDPIACAVEFVHCYSLIHDDLPAMDNDDFRRGQPSCHKAFNEATALLAGNALLTRAIAQLMPLPKAVQLLPIFLNALECDGLVGGQALEFDPHFTPRDIHDLEYIHQCKTGALLVAAVMLPLKLVSDLPMQHHDAMDKFAQAIGLGFQIQDDWLDWQPHQPQTGIIPNYVDYVGPENTQLRLHALHQQAKAALAPLGQQAAELSTVVDYLLLRTT